MCRAPATMSVTAASISFARICAPISMASRSRMSSIGTAGIRRPATYRHSGARRSREPGIHIPEARVHGFRASPFGRSRNDILFQGDINRLKPLLAAGAAGDVNDLAGDERGFVAAQEGDKIGDVARHAGAANRDLLGA